jgi:predicted nucleotidyltransferase component of viral defense system
MKDFFEKLNALGKPKRNDIVEKDYHLHRILHRISMAERLGDCLVFKGGTCLMKAYMGYYRFSEDIDFTWRDRSIWENRSKSETSRLCSAEIDGLVKGFKAISGKLGFSFSGDKRNTDDVHISSGGRMVLFFLGYPSEMLDLEVRIKVEVNFVDIALYPFKRKRLLSYAEEAESEELKFLYENPWKEYSAKVSLTCYDPRELFVEKCRASMTRKSYKLRDVLDIYFMEKRFGYSIPGYRKKIKEKTRFMLELYKRYRENIDFVEFPSARALESEEMKLMLARPPGDLERNIRRIHEQLGEVRDELLDEA